VRRRNAVVIGAAVAAMFLLVLGESVAEPRVFELPIRNGELPADLRVVRVRQGDEVTLRWTTDKALTVHLHGYDIEKSLSPRAPVLMRFTARATGRFPVEIHAHGRGGERVLAYVEVHPR
jgi:hypothetical protein